MNARDKRLRKLTRTVRARPVKPDVMRAAYEKFREIGELPEDQRIAGEIVHLVRSGLDAETAFACQGDEKTLIRAYVCAPPRPKDEAMDGLLNEAAWGTETIQWAARHMLKALASMGLDVTRPLFAGRDMKLPDYGSVGLHLLGMPECLAQPPYEEQAHRLFDRYAELRKRINRDDKRWFEACSEAVGMFRTYGELPDDELLQDAVLADGEFLLLLRHDCGEGDPEFMAAFDVAARATGEERAAAIDQVCEMVREGRLVPQP